jgi:hypothetical protein
MRIGRNHSCPCGSGQKYKRCHGAQAAQPPPSRETMIRLSRKEPAAVCLCPAAPRLGRCKGRVVASHTLQRNGGLSDLARAGRVYHFKPEFMSLESTGGEFVAVERGISQCSTFRGFCSFHDRELFREIETSPVLPTPQQAFLFSYRAVCREFYSRRRRWETFAARPDFVASAIPRMRPAINALIETEKRDLRRGLRVVKQLKQQWDEILIRGDFSSVRYWAAVIPHVPKMMCSGAFFPYVDVAGNPLQRFASDGLPPEPLALTITGLGGHGMVLFSWLADDRAACRRFVDALIALPPESMAEATVAIAAHKIENLFFSPDWWEGLDSNTRDFFTRTALSGTILETSTQPSGHQHGSALRWNGASIQMHL